MPGKSLNEWNCTQEGDFSLAYELAGKQRCESLQNQYGKRKTEVEEIRSGKIDLVGVQKSEDGIRNKKNARGFKD
jgi:hypothetical protein